MSDDWAGGAAVPSWARGRGAKQKPKGFTTELGQWWESEKREHDIARQGYHAVVSAEPLWKPDDPRWKIPESEYRFRSYLLKFGGPCVYCGEPIPPGMWALYCPVIKSVAHNACEAGKSGVRARKQTG